MLLDGRVIGPEVLVVPCPVDGQKGFGTELVKTSIKKRQGRAQKIVVDPLLCVLVK